MKKFEEITKTLLNSSEPSVQFKILVNVLSKDPNSKEIKTLQETIRFSERVKRLLSWQNQKGKIPSHPYAKFYGANFTLAILAEIGYPPGDESLCPLREQVFEWLFSKQHQSRIVSKFSRRWLHASQEGNPLFYLIRLGLFDKRLDKLVDILLESQWPDGGWNDRPNSKQKLSNYYESRLVMRGLYWYWKQTGNKKVKIAAEKTAEFFLRHKLVEDVGDKRIRWASFPKLHYPAYHHYDLLSILTTLADLGKVTDTRCVEALDLLESKWLPDGGFPAEAKYYRLIAKQKLSNGSLVDWGGVGKKQMNEFVSADVLYVLKKAKRIK